MTKKQLEELHEQGLVLCTEQVVAEDGTISYVTEAVSELKKDARAHILSCMNHYLKQEKGAKAGFSYNTAMPVFNQFCTQENSQLIVITHSPSVAKLVGGLAIAGGIGAVISPMVPVTAVKAIGTVAGTAVGMGVNSSSGKAFKEFTKAHKKELQDAINEGWEHRVEIKAVIKANAVLPDRVVIKFYKNGGKKSAKHESATFDFSYHDEKKTIIEGYDLSKIDKDKSIIEKEVNKTSKEAFEKYKKSEIEKYKPRKSDTYMDMSSYNDAKRFCSKTAPTVASFEVDDSNQMQIFLHYPVADDNDQMLFYQIYLIKELNKNKKLSSLGYKFEGEDYLGIYIVPKR